MTAGLFPIHAGWMVPHVLQTLSGGGSGLLVDAVRFSHTWWLEPAAGLTDRGLSAHSGSGVAVSGTPATDASCLAGHGRVRRPTRVLQFLPIAGGQAFDVQVLLVMMGTGHRYGTRTGVGDLVPDPALDVLPRTASSPHQSAGCSSRLRQPGQPCSSQLGVRLVGRRSDRYGRCGRWSRPGGAQPRSRLSTGPGCAGSAQRGLQGLNRDEIAWRPTQVAGGAAVAGRRRHCGSDDLDVAGQSSAGGVLGHGHGLRRLWRWSAAERGHGRSCRNGSWVQRCWTGPQRRGLDGRSEPCGGRAGGPDSPAAGSVDRWAGGPRLHAERDLARSDDHRHAGPTGRGSGHQRVGGRGDRPALARHRCAERDGRGRGRHPGRGAVGQSFTYRFVADQTGTYWYHSHQVSHEQVVGGLFGALVVKPRRSSAAGVEVDRPSAHLRRHPHRQRSPRRPSGAGASEAAGTGAGRQHRQRTDARSGPHTPTGCWPSTGPKPEAPPR